MANAMSLLSGITRADVVQDPFPHFVTHVEPEVAFPDLPNFSAKLNELKAKIG